MRMLPFTLAAAMAIFSAESLMPNRAEARAPGAPAGALNAADGIGMVEPAQFAPDPRARTEYGTLRAGRPQPACHWERNYKTGTSAWVCRTKERYDANPRYRRIVSRYRR